jgi:hypothetical protein
VFEAEQRTALRGLEAAGYEALEIGSLIRVEDGSTPEVVTESSLSKSLGLERSPLPFVGNTAELFFKRVYESS